MLKIEHFNTLCDSVDLISVGISICSIKGFTIQYFDLLKYSYKIKFPPLMLVAGRKNLKNQDDILYNIDLRPNI